MRRAARLAPILYIVSYCLVQLPWLVRFPFVHSDESWLGGLSRAMLASGSIGCTEPFFNAKQRYPHALKTLFHLLQQGVIALAGYHPFALRLLSLLTACICLLVVYACAVRLLGARLPAFCTMVLLSVDIQFLYAAHFARSEIFLVLALCCCTFCLLNTAITNRTALCCAVYTGVMVFFHPNSFLLACACGCALAYRCWLQGRRFHPLSLYCIVTGSFAAVGVALSYALDSQFLPHYFAYGQEEFSLWAGAGERLTGLAGFFERLWMRNSGTYYLPDIRIQLLLFLGAVLLCGVFAIVMRRECPREACTIGTMLCMGSGLLSGIALVGRLNQTYVVFLFPLGVLLVALACRIVSQRYTAVLLTVCVAAALAVSMVQVRAQLALPTYASFTAQLQALVPSNEKTLGNLNAGFSFENEALLDYRNLPYALERQTVADYVREFEIQYILYSDELDFIYENRPYYNVIYGNPMFVPALREFCETQCTQLGQFQNTGYGARIAPLVGDTAYGNVTVYRVGKS